MPSVTNYAYVVNAVNSNTVSMYKIDDATGVLKPLDPPTVGTGITPAFIAITTINNVQYAYVTNIDSGTVSMYKIDDTTGLLNPLGPPTVATEEFPYAITITTINNVHYVYVTNRNSNTVSMYKIDDTTGLLNPLGPPTVETGNIPFYIAITTINNVHYVYVTNRNSNTVSMYKIDDTTGLLNPLGPPTVATESNPDFIAITTINNVQYAYVTNNGNDTVSMYKIDDTTGVLNPLEPKSTVATEKAPFAIAITTINNVQYAYVTNYQSGTVSMYKIDDTTGVLNPLEPKSTVKTGSLPALITITTINNVHYAYVTNFDSNTVSMYKIDDTTGVLNQLDTPTVKTKPGPIGITTAIANTCFPKNTPIVTDQGIIFIQDIDTSIHTINGKKIVAITKTVTPEKHLICFEKDSLRKNFPNKRTIMTKEHAVLYKGEMVKACNLLHLDGIRKIKYNGEILYNVLMETHDKIKINNLTCETLNPNTIVAKIYNSKVSDEIKNNLIIEMNGYKKNKDREALKKFYAKL